MYRGLRMILRSWGCKVPLEKADAFAEYLCRTGIADYKRQAGCHDVRLMRHDSNGWAQFLLQSHWVDYGSIEAYAGANSEIAVLYPDDEAYDLVADLRVTHYEIVPLPKDAVG